MSTNLTTGKIAEVMFEKAVDTYEHQTLLLKEVTLVTPEERMMQNANNVVWYPVQQHAPILNGWDLTGQETNIIEETYPSILEEPANDFVLQRADDMRDRVFWERRGEQSGKRQATELNKRLAERIALQGSLFFRTSDTSGYNFISNGQAIQNERQAVNMGRSFLLNDRDTQFFSQDLAGRQTLQGRPEETWKTGQIGQNVAEYDVFTGSFLPNLAGGADPAAAVTATVSEAPEGGTVDPITGQVTNVDYREGTILVPTAGYNVGDKVSFSNAGTPVQSVGLADKTETNQAMTFTIVRIIDAASLVVYPKPIALDDPALTSLEQAYANINTQILVGATMNRLNIDTSAKTNLFWEKSAVEVIGGTIPAQLFSQFAGKQVITKRLSDGLEMYMVYDGRIDDMTFRYRLFVWYGITICNPSNCGVAIRFTAP